MTDLACVLVSDGSSDVVLIPILEWLKHQHGAPVRRAIRRYDPSRFRDSPRQLDEKLSHALQNHTCDLLFVHRDAEREHWEKRENEVRQALDDAAPTTKSAVPVIPVRMTEAWLLFDEAAIRHAAGCPRGRTPLRLGRDPEAIPDPKELLHRSLREASELRGRRLERFNVAAAVHHVVERIDDFSPLRALPAFQRLEASLSRLLREGRWSGR